MTTRLARTLAIAVMVAASPAPAFVTFETGQVRPLALSPDGSRLFAVNTPDNRLEIFDVGSGSLTHAASVPVGLEPCAVAVRSADEVWVVNHLSDSVTIVDVGSTPPRVAGTLLVGDEPRDIVFASGRAFITTAHRGQNSPVDPVLTTEGVGRADVWVFDPTALGTSLGGTPLTILTLFGDTPRALAVGADATTVYAAVFHSGNQTTALSEGLVCDGGSGVPPCSVSGSSMPGGLPAPNANVQGVPGPETGLIVRFEGGQWRDRLGRDWSGAVRFSLPDLDVFAIDADAPVPVQTASFAHVGTILYGMVVNPVSGAVYVANTEARNEQRFEGPGTLAGSTVQGHLHESRITVISGSTVSPRHLNKHIDYDVRPAPPGVRDDSVSLPTGMAISSDGQTLYLAAFGSAKVAVFDTAALENDSFVPDAADHVQLTAGGPSGVVLDETRAQLYALTRFDNGISVVDTATLLEVAHTAMHNPEPAHVEAGRPVLYDAFATSSNGESPCASCHVFGDFDSLAWDLGNPDDVVATNPNPIRVGGGDPDFHPLKGPMTTQSLRGMAGHGPMHWRGDRTAGSNLGGDPLDERGAFREFIVAFEGLLGRGTAIDAADMDAFAGFILDVTYPPNPIRALDNSLTPEQASGRDLYFRPGTDIIESCNGCHTLDPASGFFGGDGQTTFEAEPQMFKVPHLRNLYQKVGMFGMPAVPFFASGNNGHLGDQVRGFGFLHDGSVDTLFRFHGANVFVGLSAQDQADLEQLMLAFDSNLAPIVGQQITIGPGSPTVVGQRIDLLLERAAANECDVVVKGVLAGEPRGWMRLPNGTFQSDRASEAPIAEAALRAAATTAGHERTYTCVPPGSGMQIGIDRDGDGHFDQTEIDAGSDPADPTSIPPGATTTSTTSSTTTTFPPPPPPTMIETTMLRLKAQSPGVGISKTVLVSSTKGDPPVHRIMVGDAGGPGDPRVHGGALTVRSAAGQETTVPLAPSGWRAIGRESSPRGYKFYGPAGGTLFVRSVKMQADKLALKALLEMFLSDVPQGTMTFRIDVGLARYCGEAPPKARGNPPSSARFDNVRRWVAQPKSPPPAACLPAG